MRHHPYLVFSPIPGWHGRYTHYNSLGFRGAEISLKKPAHVFRIAVLGGSTAFGAFVKDEQTLPATLRDLVQANITTHVWHTPYQSVEVINAAVPGFVSTQELISLVLKVLPLHPDLVVIFDGLNDVFSLGAPPNAAWRMDEWDRQCTMTMSERIKPLMLRSSAALRLARNLFHGIEERIRGAVHRQPPTPAWTLRPGALEESTSVYLENLRSMLSLLKVRDIAAITVNQPARLWAMPEDDVSAVKVLGEKHFRAMRSLRDTLKIKSQQITAQFGRHYTFVDLDNLSTVPEFFVDDDMHFSDAGNRAAAQKIADSIVTQQRRDATR
jgi:lysophospholipase L1-like esterase